MKYSYLLHFRKLSKIFSRRERFSNKNGISSGSLCGDEKRRKTTERRWKGEKGGNESHKNELFSKEKNGMWCYDVFVMFLFLCKNLLSICMKRKVSVKKRRGKVD